VKLGDRIYYFRHRCVNRRNHGTQKIVADYAIHYVKSGGKIVEKSIQAEDL
jgi:hypothetical protein